MTVLVATVRWSNCRLAGSDGPPDSRLATMRPKKKPMNTLTPIIRRIALGAMSSFMSPSAVLMVESLLGSRAGLAARPARRMRRRTTRPATDYPCTATDFRAARQAGRKRLVSPNNLSIIQNGRQPDKDLLPLHTCGMPRPERPLDPTAGPIAHFASEMRQLRESAGSPKYLTMARLTGRSRTALAEAAGGDHLPTWETVESFVRSCQGDPAAWRLKWETARDSSRRADAAVSEVVSVNSADAEAPGKSIPLAQPTHVTDDSDQHPTHRKWWTAAAMLGIVVVVTAAVLTLKPQEERPAAATSTPGPTAILSGQRGEAADLTYGRFSSERLVSGGAGGILTVWNTATGTWFRTINTHAAISAVMTDPFHRNIIASAGAQGLVRLWNTESGEGLQTLTLDAPSRTSQLAFDPISKNQLVASNGNGQVELWNGLAGDRIRVLGRRGPAVIALAFDPLTRNTVATATASGAVEIWDTSNGAFVRRMEPLQSKTTHICFDPFTPNTLIGATESGQVVVWDSSKGKQVRSFAVGAPVRSVALNPTIPNSVIVGDAKGRLEVRDVSNGVAIHLIRGQGPSVSAMSFAPDGKTLAVGQDNGFIALWPIEDWKS